MTQRSQKGWLVGAFSVIVQLQTSRRFISSSTLKVIGFSFYGNPNSTKSKERKYFQGIEDNLALLPKHYPGWTIRNAGTFIDIDIANIILKKTHSFNL